MNENYPSAGEIVRNLAQVTSPYEVVSTHGRFRIVRFDSPFWGGYEFWVVNEKGFLWEPAEDLEAAHEYLRSPEAAEYNQGD